MNGKRDEFKEKVQSMTAKEIIMAMVNGLKAEHVRVNMMDFGSVQDGICFGCAATNAVCEIAGRAFVPSDYAQGGGFIAQAIALDTDLEFLTEFEVAVDYLRQGSIQNYNCQAVAYGFAEIQCEDEDEDALPMLSSNCYRGNLAPYIALAEAQA